MAEILYQEIDSDGLEATFEAAAAGGDTVDNSYVEALVSPFLWIKNGDVNPTTVTIEITQTVDGQAVEDKEVVIPAGEERLIGPFPQSAYGITLNLSYSNVTAVTIAALRFAKGI